MQAIEETCPLEDRVPERCVFGGITKSRAYNAMTRACRDAKVPHYHPHDLRHRRITVWHQSGVPARELAERAGHSRPSMSLDVYSHVMPAGRDRVRTVSVPTCRRASRRFEALVAELLPRDDLARAGAALGDHCDLTGLTTVGALGVHDENRTRRGGRDP